MLMANNIRAVAYHAGLDANTRAQRQDMFLLEEVEVMWLTSPCEWVSTNRMYVL